MKKKPIKGKVKQVKQQATTPCGSVSMTSLNAEHLLKGLLQPSKINLNTLINLDLNIKDKLFITIETDDGREFEIRVTGKVKI